MTMTTQMKISIGSKVNTQAQVEGEGEGANPVFFQFYMTIRVARILRQISK
jgi:hypothetical protein